MGHMYIYVDESMRSDMVQFRVQRFSVIFVNCCLRKNPDSFPFLSSLVQK